jgi:hypothetical protein
MAATKLFWLDANVFITAKDGPYRFSVSAGFWTFLAEQAKAGTVRCPKMVYDEIVHNIAAEDQLAKWIKVRKSTDLFVPNPNKAVQDVVRDIANHVSPRYPQHQVAKFLRGADPFIIAHAKESQGTVVTFEKLVPSNSQQIKIPNVCEEFEVSYCTLYDMLERLKAKFVQRS